MTHAQDDARRILAIAHSNQTPLTHQEKRVEAADKLVSDLVAAAAAVGLAGSADPDGHKLFVLGHGKIRVLVGAGEQISLRYVPNASGIPVPAATVADLEYDPLAGTMVGKQVDPDIAPTPGQRLPRMHPLKVLATLAADLADPKPQTPPA